jgi:hypothetical protein
VVLLTSTRRRSPHSLQRTRRSVIVTVCSRSLLRRVTRLSCHKGVTLRRPCPWRSSWGWREQGHLLCVVPSQAIAPAADQQHDRPVGQASEARTGQQRVAEEVGPLARRPVAGQDDARLFVPFVDDVLQIGRAAGGQRLEAEVVADEQVRLGVGGLSSLPSARPALMCTSIWWAEVRRISGILADSCSCYTLG